MGKKNKYEQFSKQAQAANKRFRQCERKQAYETQALSEHKGQTTYLCPHCNKWHRSASFQKLVSYVSKKRRNATL